jgi:hypothetical protein
MKPSVSVVALVAVVWHLVFAFSIVDIYFRSPIVAGVEPVCHDRKLCCSFLLSLSLTFS